MADFNVIEEIQHYAAGRKKDVERGAETPALAALMLEKYGEGMAKMLSGFGGSNASLMQEVDRLVREIDPQYPKHRQYRFEAKPAGLAVNGSVL